MTRVCQYRLLPGPHAVGRSCVGPPRADMFLPLRGFCTGPGWHGAKLILTEQRFVPIWLCRTPRMRRFSNYTKACSLSHPCKGGVGGVGPARSVTRSSHGLSLSALSHPSREAGRAGFECQGSRPTPPAPPLQGGEKERSLDYAQQEHASRYLPSSSVNTNFSSAQAPAQRCAETVKEALKGP